MKKYLLILVSLVLVLSLCSCSNAKGPQHDKAETSSNDLVSNEPTEKEVDKRILGIYEIVDTLGASANVVYRNQLVSNEKEWSDDSVEKIVSRSLFDQSFEFEYEKSFTMSFRGPTYHSYTLGDMKIRTMEGSEEITFVCNIVDGFAKIEIPEDKNIESIRQKLEEEVICRMISLEGFVLTPPSEYGEAMDFIYEKKVQNYTVESIMVVLHSDGRVTSFSYEYDPEIDLELLSKIDENYANEVLIAKLKDMYEINGTTVISETCQATWTTAITYEGETYVEYFGIRVQIKKVDGTIENRTCSLLVPVSALIPPTE